MDNDIIPEPIEFEWDSGNTLKNFKKHGIENDESESVFLDKNSVLAEDLKHSEREERFQLFGRSNKNRLLTVIFAIRKYHVRIISARQMNTKERRFYESQKT